MKKILALVTGAALLLTSAIFTSCGDAADTKYSASEDTIITLDAPSVSGKAYYGFNYIWWNAIPSATSYEVYRNGIRQTTLDGNTYTDASVQDGVSYKYEVIAIGGGSAAGSSAGVPSRAVYLRASKGEITLTGNIPTPTEYENAVTSALSIDATGSSSKVKFEEASDGFFGVTFPAKAWLSYTVYVVTKGLVTEYSDPLTLATVADTSTVANADSLREENYDAHVVLAPSVGEKEIYVVASARAASLNASSVLASYDKVSALSKDTASLEAIDEGTGPSSVKAYWLDKTAFTARVIFTPATTSANKADATTNHVVYSKRNNVWTKLTGEVKTEDTVSYYIDDTLADGDYDVTYYVVHTDGTRYGNKASTTLSAIAASYADAATFDFSAASSTLSSSRTIYGGLAFDEDNKTNDLVFDVTVSSGTTLALSYAYDSSSQDTAIANAKAGTNLVDVTLPETTAQSAASNKKYLTYTIVLKDLDNGSYVFRAVTSKDGKTDNYVYAGDKSDTALYQIKIGSTNIATEDPSLTIRTAAFDATDLFENDITIEASTAAGVEQTLKLYYGYSATSAAAAQAIAKATPTAFTWTVEPVVSVDSNGDEVITYNDVLKNVEEGYYYFILVAAETGRVSAYDTQAKTVSSVLALDAPTTFTVELKDINAGDYENDVEINVTSAAADVEQTLTVTYGYSTSSLAEAQYLAYTTSAKTWTWTTEAIDNGNDTISYYDVIENLADGYYYFMVTASADGYLSATKEATAIAGTTPAEIKIADANKVLSAPETFTATLKDVTAGEYANDVIISVTSAADKPVQTLTVKYGVSESSLAEAQYLVKTAQAKTFTWTTEPTVTENTEGKYTVTYNDIIEDLADGYYFFTVTASADGYLSATKEAATTPEAGIKIAADDKALSAPTTFTVTKTALGSDKVVNDIEIKVVSAAAPIDQTITVTYGYSANSPEQAENYAYNASKVKTIAWDATNTGITSTPDSDGNYTIEYYQAVEDLADGYYYFYVVASDATEKYLAASEIATTTESAGNLTIDTAETTNIYVGSTTVQFVTAGANTTENFDGFYFTFTGKPEFTYKIGYAYSAIRPAAAQYLAKIGGSNVTDKTPTSYTEYSTVDNGYVNDTYRLYGGVVDLTAAELKAGYYAFIVTATDGTDSAYDVADAMHIAEPDEVGVLQLSDSDINFAGYNLTLNGFGAPILSLENLDNDGLVNDVSDFTITIKDTTKAKLSAVRYATAKSLDAAKAKVLSATTSVTLPTPVSSSVTLDEATYTFSEAIKNIPTGEYVAVIAILSDGDTTDDYNYADAFVLAYSSDKASVVPNYAGNLKLTVSQYEATSTNTDKNDFMFNVEDAIGDSDSIDNYTYTLEYATYEYVDTAINYTKTWTKLTDLTMVLGKNSEGYLTGTAQVNDSSESVHYYVATAKWDNAPDAYYVFRVVKHSLLDEENDKPVWDSDSSNNQSWQVNTATPAAATPELSAVAIAQRDFTKADGTTDAEKVYIVVTTTTTETEITKDVLEGTTYTVYKATRAKAADDLINSNFEATPLTVSKVTIGTGDDAVSFAAATDTKPTTDANEYLYYVKAVRGDDTVYSNIVKVSAPTE